MGTDTRRAAYASVRGALIWRSLAERRRVARASGDPGLKIPVETGFLTLGGSRFPEIAEIIPEARQRVQRQLDSGLEWQKKMRLRTELLSPSELDLDSPYMRFALRTDILQAVSAYLGVVPILRTVDVWYSRNHPGKFADSELFHCDWADQTQMKVFVYCSEVDHASGPLVVIPAGVSKSVRQRLRYEYQGKRHGRVEDAEMASLVGERCGEALVGAPGTTSFVDTSRCFHYGSRITEAARPRIVAICQYVTPTSFAFPLDYRKNAPFRHLARPEASALQRLALGAD